MGYHYHRRRPGQQRALGEALALLSTVLSEFEGGGAGGAASGAARVAVFHELFPQHFLSATGLFEDLEHRGPTADERPLWGLGVCVRGAGGGGDR